MLSLCTKITSTKMAQVKLKHVAVIVIFTINSCLTITDNFPYMNVTSLPTLYSYSVSCTGVFQKTDPPPPQKT
jgi:hypothetical protein